MKKSIERILAPVDFSEASLNALETAASLARKNNSELYVMYAQDDILESIVSGTSATSNSSANSSEVLSALCDDLKKKFRLQPVIIEVRAQANEAILGSAVSKQADLIVMGTYGKAGYRKAHIGTTAYSVLKYAPCAVLLVPPGTRRTSFKKILYPIRPIATAFRHYELVSQLLERNASIDVIGLYSADERDSLYDINDLLVKLEPRMSSDNVKYNLILSWAIAMPQTVLKEAEEKQSELIVLTPATDPTTNPFYVGPRTYQIVQNAKVPVLLLSKNIKYIVENLRQPI